MEIIIFNWLLPVYEGVSHLIFAVYCGMILPMSSYGMGLETND
jgi:hypothetical protein